MNKNILKNKKRLHVTKDGRTIINSPSFLRDVHVNHLLSQAVKTILDELNISCCGIWLMDGDKKFIPRIVFGVKEELYAMSHSKRFSRLLRAVTRRGKHVAINNLSMLKDKKLRKAVKREQLNSLVAYPLVVRDFTIGTLVLCVREKEESLTPERINIGEIIAKETALILDNVYLYKKTLENSDISSKRGEGALVLVRKIRNITQVTDDMKTNVENLLQEIHKLCSVDFIYIKKCDKTRKNFNIINVFPHSNGFSQEQKKVDAILDEESAIRVGPLAVSNLDIYCKEKFHRNFDLGYKSYLSFPMFEGSHMIGVTSMYWKYPRVLGEIEYHAIETICSMLSVFITHSDLLGKVKNGALNSIKTLATLTETKDEYTHGHSKKVMHNSLLVCKQLKLSEAHTDIIRNAALLHDVGKVVVDNSILRKKSPLSNLEWEEIKKHPVIGANIVSKTGFLSNIAPAIKYHHEKFSGGGYPEPEMKRYNIPIASRIIAVADAYDAMSSNRAYRDALDRNEILNQLKKNSGKQFDPKIVRIFTKVIMNV